MNLDGSVPGDNPKLAGVVSHVYSYGHRNTQGIDFAPDGTLYGSEHGPHTDDEVNVIRAGGNYGWPHVAGRQDDKFYVYARWADSSATCEDLTYDFTRVPDSVPFAQESDYKEPSSEPSAPLFTSADGEFAKKYSTASSSVQPLACSPVSTTSRIARHISPESLPKSE